MSESVEAVQEPPVSHEKAPLNLVDIKVTHGKNAYELQLDLSATTVGELKAKLQELSNVPVVNQKLMLKGMMKNDADTLAAAGCKAGCKIILMGSTIQQMVEAALPPKKMDTGASSVIEAPAVAEPLSARKEHLKIIEKGPPEDVERAVKGVTSPVPPSISGLMNKQGVKIRLTFKPEELWIASQTTTQKLPYSTISRVESEPIHTNDGYHILVFQIGSSEASKYYVYWVPCQYVQAIKTHLHLLALM